MAGQGKLIMSANAVYHLTRLMPRIAQGFVQSFAATAVDTLMSFAKSGASDPPGPRGSNPQSTFREG